ncbi:hypothetical protein [Hafnia alvei]|uniref:hypothetical protein n=1 Tax=Hafnia alvei TaxID=569 RepID=UPI00345D85E9
MNKKQIGIFLIGTTFLLSGCSSSNKENQNYRGDELEYDYFYANSQLTPTEENTPPKSSIVGGHSYSSTNNKCMDNYNFLREEKSSQYPKYAENYNKITDGFKFLNSNKNIMDKDAKKVYTMELKMKLETLCSKIQYSSFILVNEKRKNLSEI